MPLAWKNDPFVPLEWYGEQHEMLLFEIAICTSASSVLTPKKRVT
jgi:hypothetical protein